MDDAMVWFANGPDFPQDFGFLKKFWLKEEAHFGAFFGVWKDSRGEIENKLAMERLKMNGKQMFYCK